MAESTREIFSKTDVRPEQVAGISFCSQMQGLILVDKNGIPVHRAMLLVFLFYVPFAPFTIWMEHALADVRGWNEYVVLGINMAMNLSLEYLWDRFVVYRDSLDTNDVAKKQQEKDAQ